MPTIIDGPTYHDGSTSHADALLSINTHGIELINSNENARSYPADHHIIPGMIDMHIHGSCGADVMDGTPEALQIIADSLLKQGTTGFLATTMTAPIDEIEKVLINISEFSAQQTHGATVLGAHLEGPFLAPEFTGAQRRELIIPPDIALFKQWQAASNNIIKMVTLAPEHQGAIEFIQYLTDTNVIASFGHSAANYQQTNASIDAGITHATHLFNAMQGVHHRRPGAVTALLLRKEVYAELICDNKHLSPSIIDLSYQMKTAEKLILVTDATRAQCMPDGEYELGGQAIAVKNKTVRLPDGTLAGSVVTLPEAIHYTMAATDCSWNDIVAMTSKNPATQLGVATRGAVILNAQAKVIDVITA
jgi:N-acetylglucosamine-6-phosphate deacetylase